MFVTLRVTVIVPPVEYVWDMVEDEAVSVCPSPKSQAYDAILPPGDEEPEASKLTVLPLTV